MLGNLSVAPSAEIAGYLGALAHGDTVQLMSEKKAITLAPSVLARCAGVYQFAGRTMTIRVEGGQLAANPAQPTTTSSAVSAVHRSQVDVRNVALT